MSKIKTLNEIGQLESCGYGVPWPRHGLHLLYWFCNDYVSFDNNGDLVALEHPETENFGFHLFYNRPEDDGYPLLPGIDIPYYEVGNLFFPGADDLPDDVLSNVTEEDHHSDMDRIIISIYPDREVDKVYVTQHHGAVSFDRQNTFRISKGLVRTISNLDLEDGLLRRVGYRSKTKSSRNLPKNHPSYLLSYTETPREPAVARTRVPISPKTHVLISPETHVPISPETRVPISPETHVPISPETRVPISPETRVPISPETRVPISPETRVPISPETRVFISPESRGGRSLGGGERELRDDKPERTCNCVIL